MTGPTDLAIPSALVRRRRRSLQAVAAVSGGFGAMVAIAISALLVFLTGGGTVSIAMLVAFALVTGSLGGWLLGRAASRMLEGP